MSTLVEYHWRELPQVSYRDKTGLLSWQMYACHEKLCVCRDKTHLLSWQNYACHDKTFVATNACLLWQIFVMTKRLYFVATNITKSFVMASILLSWLKMCFVVTNTCLSWQIRVCHDKKDTCGSPADDSRARHLELGPKRFTMAIVALFSASEQAHCAPVVYNSEWVTVLYTVCFEWPLKWLQRCCYMAGAAKWNCCRLGPSCVFVMQPCQQQWHFTLKPHA